MAGGNTEHGAQYFTVDHLGLTRMVTDGDGMATSRYDYFPFGGVIPAGYGNRTAVGGYDAGSGDWVNPRFTGKLRDYESGLKLDYFGARYYATITGYNSLLVMIGMTAGPLFSGILHDLTGDYRYAFLTLAGVAVVASVAAVLARPPGPPSPGGASGKSADRYIT